MSSISCHHINTKLDVIKYIAGKIIENIATNTEHVQPSNCEVVNQ